MRYPKVLIIFSSALLMNSTMETAAQFYRLTPDSVYYSEYNSLTGEMDYSGANYNYYSEKILDSTYTADKTGAITAKSVYTYFDGMLMEALSSVVNQGIMVPNQKRVFTHDGSNRAATALVTKWKEGQWENLNWFTYTYDGSNRLIVYRRKFWQNNAWTDFSIDSLFYNELGWLTERRVTSVPTGKFITRKLYNYNMYGRKTIETRQDFTNNVWTNVSRIYYYYNNCGTLTTTLTERWHDGLWQKESSSETFYTTEVMPGYRRFPVCNNGKTIFVRISKLQKFLDKGACPGICLNNETANDLKSEAVETRSVSIPFVVYPNPAGESVSIRMKDPDCPALRIELLDYSGRLIIASEPESQEITTLNLSSLRAGSYIVRVTSDTVYSTVISKR